VRDQIASLKVKLEAQTKVLREELRSPKGDAAQRDLAMENLNKSRDEMVRLHSVLEGYARRVEIAGLHERAPLPPLPRQQEEADEYRITQEEADEYPVVGSQVAAQEKDKKGKPRAPAAGSPQSQTLSQALDAAAKSTWSKLARTDAATSLASFFGHGPARDAPAGHQEQEPLDFIDFFEADDNVVAQ